MNRRFSVTLEGNISPYTRSLDAAAARTNRFAGEAERAGDRAGTGIARGLFKAEGGFSRSAISADLMNLRIREAGITAIGFFGGAALVNGFRRVGQAIVGVVRAGSDLTETTNKAGETFGQATVIVTNGADEMARRFGVVKNVFIDAASSIGLIVRAAGLTQPAAAAMSTSLARLAADATSFFNVPLPQILQDIRSGLVGEIEPLRKYGVLLSEANTQNEAVAIGVARVGDQLTDQQKVLARVSLIQKGLAVASGDLARTQDSLANRFRAVQGHVVNWAASLGQRATPAINSVLDASYRLGRDGLNVLEGALGRLSPFFSGVVRAGENVVRIFRAGEQAVGPFVRGLAAVGGTAIIGVLNVLGIGLEQLSGFLARNEGLVKALAIAYTASLVPGMVRWIATLGQMLAMRAEAFILRLTTTFGTLRTAVAANQPVLQNSTGQLQLFATTETVVAGRSAVLSAALGVVRAAFLAAVPIAFVAAIGAAVSAFESARAHARDFIAEIKGGRDLATESGLQQYIQDLERQGITAQEAANRNRGLAGSLRGTLEVFSPLANTVADADAKYAALAGEVDNARGALDRLESNTAKVVVATGLTKDSVVELAKKMGIDLTTSSNSAIQSLIAAANAAVNSGTVIKGVIIQLSDAQKAAQSGLEQISGPDVAFDKSLEAQRKAQQLAEESARQGEQQRKAAERAARDAARRPLEIAQAQLALERATIRVGEAQRALVEAQEDQARAGELVARSERELQAAYDDQRRAVFALLDAERALEDARRHAAERRSLIEGGFALARAQEAQAAAAADVAQAQEKLAAAQDHGTPEEIAQSQRELNEALRRQKEAAFEAEDAQVALNRVRDDSTNNRDVIEAESGVGDAQRQSADAADAVRDKQRELDHVRSDVSSAKAVRDAELDIRDALLAVQSAHQSLVDAQRPADDAMDSFKSNTDDAKFSLQNWQDQLKQSIQDAVAFSDNLAWIASQGGPPAVIEALQKMGAKGVEIAAAMRGQLPPQLQAMFDQMVADAILKTDQWQFWVTAKTQGGAAAANFWTGEMVTGIATKLGVTPEAARRIMQQYLGVLDSAFASAAQVTGQQPPGSSAQLFISQLGQLVTGQGQVQQPQPFNQDFIKGLLPQARGGVVQMGAGANEQHVAQVAAPGTWRLWAEDPKSGREAYIPERGDPTRAYTILNEAASWYGARVVSNATGNLVIPKGNVRGGGSVFGPQLEGALDRMREMGQRYVDALLSAAAPPQTVGGVPGNIAGGRWQDITGFLDSRGVPYTATSTTGGTHVAGSYHYRGKAVDLVGDMRRIFFTLLDAKNTLAELFWTPAGFSIKNSQEVRPPIAASGHYDHVHAAVYDQGGYLQPGWTMAFNGTGRPEPVGAGGLTINVHPNAVTWDFRGLAVANINELEQMMRRTAKETTDGLVSDVLREAARFR